MDFYKLHKNKNYIMIKQNPNKLFIKNIKKILRNKFATHKI